MRAPDSWPAARSQPRPTGPPQKVLFHNTAAASAIADRLVHKGLLVRIKGKSRRSEQDLGDGDDAA